MNMETATLPFLVCNKNAVSSVQSNMLFLISNKNAVSNLESKILFLITNYK